MRRVRKEATKVWHNPEIFRPGQKSAHGAKPAEPTAEERRASRTHRAALEALFSPRKDVAEESSPAKEVVTPKPVGRIVLAPPPQSDPKALERQRLLSRLLAAEGRPQITKTANDFIQAGYSFPEEQDVYLQLLEHSDEEHVCDAIDKLIGIFAGELPKRRAVLESRLRRIEQFADEEATRRAAERLRRVVSGRASSPPTSHAAQSE